VLFVLPAAVWLQYLIAFAPQEWYFISGRNIHSSFIVQQRCCDDIPAEWY